MRFISLFSKHMALIYRCISVAAAVLIAGITAYYMILGDYSLMDYRLYINAFALAFVIFTIAWPVKIEFLATVTLVYAVEILITTPLRENLMGFMMYVLTCAILFSRGFFRKNRMAKIIMSIIIFFGLFATQLRFGANVFVESIFILAEYAFVVFLIILFYYLYLRNQGKSPIEKELDLSLFPELTERDKEWIELILQETKYSTIASQYKITEGAVKNRMRLIFKTLDVSDRIGFMATYGGFTIKK